MKIADKVKIIYYRIESKACDPPTSLAAYEIIYYRIERQ